VPRFDLDGLRRRLGERWEPFLAYSVDRARTASEQQANHHLLAALKDEATWPDRNCDAACGVRLGSRPGWCRWGEWLGS
jgi:hypothetical protein